MKPLDIGDMLIDPGKSSILLHYIAEATYKQNERELARQKVRITLERLKKIGSKELRGHLEDLENEIHEAIQKSRMIKTRQEKEDKQQEILEKRIKTLSTKLEKYLEKQANLEKRLDNIEKKKPEKTEIKEKIKKLKKMHEEIKKTKKNKEQLENIKKRIQTLEKAVKEV